MASPTRLRPSLAPLLAALAALVPHAVAQCTTYWTDDNPLPGVNQTIGNVGVTAVGRWDSDGAGPLPPRIVAAGAFSIAGGTAAEGIVAWDPTAGTWQPLGAGIGGGFVFALASLPTGELVAAGSFTTAGGAPAAGIARWNGSAWSPLGSGTNGNVHALAVLPNGDLVAGGAFTTAGGVPANRIARWNGTTWSPISTGMDDQVNALAVLPSGDLVAGGSFTLAGAAPVGRVARWNGTGWSAMHIGVNDSVFALAVMPNGDVIAGGAFSSASLQPASRIARWNGTNWSPLGTGVTASQLFGPFLVQSLLVDASGELVVGGWFQFAGGIPAKGIARWNGTAWSTMGTGIGTNSPVQALGLAADGTVVAGGRFSLLDGEVAPRLARWNGTSWSTPADGFPSVVRNVAVLANGEILACGTGPIARRTSSGWTVLRAGPPSSSVDDLTGPLGSALAACVTPGGDVIAGGYFTLADGVPANRVARWNGSTWSPLGAGVSGGDPTQVNAIAVLPNGDVVVGGRFTVAGSAAVDNIARWNGSAWSALGAGIAGEVHVLAVMPNGDVIAGGYFTAAGGVPMQGIARWDGTAWSSFGAGLAITTPYIATVNGLAVAAGGDLYVAGAFEQAGGQPMRNVARWTGSAWLPLGAGIGTNLGEGAGAIALLPDGDVVVGGTFATAGSVAATNLARWDGSNWSALGSGANDSVAALAALPDGGIVAGGWFTQIDGKVSAYVGRLATTCPAAATTTGAGCPGSGGNNSLAPVTLPFLGGTFTARGTGLPANAPVLAVWGVTALPQGSLPLTIAFAQAGPGCDALVFPDFTGVFFATGNAAVSSIAVPDSPTLVGVVFYHQMVPFELDGLGGVVAVTASNALQLTIGAF